MSGTLCVLLVFSSCGTVTVTGIQNSVDCTGVTSTFAADVVPVFTSRGCTNSACHTGTSPAGGLDLDASGVNADIYSNLLATNAVDPDSDPSDPLNTRLLAFPVKGQEDHGDGGDIFEDLTDVDYIDIYCWVESGAANN